MLSQLIFFFSPLNSITYNIQNTIFKRAFIHVPDSVAVQSGASMSKQCVLQVLVNVIVPFTTFLHLMLNDSKYVVFTSF